MRFTRTPAEARALGMTRRGLLLGLPVYVGPCSDPDGLPAVLAVWRPFEGLVPWLALLSVALSCIVLGDERLGITHQHEIAAT